MAERKRGALSTPDMNFILENHDKMSVAEIAEALNRNEEPIKKFILNQKTKIEPQDDDEIAKKKLTMEFFWPMLKLQLSKVEQEYFICQWIEFMRQFSEDVLPSEKQQIKALILNEIYKNRAGIELKNCQDDIERLNKLIQKEETKNTPDLNKINLWTTQISMAKAAVQGYRNSIEGF